MWFFHSYSNGNRILLLHSMKWLQHCPWQSSKFHRLHQSKMHLSSDTSLINQLMRPLPSLPYHPFFNNKFARQGLWCKSRALYISQVVDAKLKYIFFVIVTVWHFHVEGAAKVDLYDKTEGKIVRIKHSRSTQGDLTP